MKLVTLFLLLFTSSQALAGYGLPVGMHGQNYDNTISSNGLSTSVNDTNFLQAGGATCSNSRYVDWQKEFSIPRNRWFQHTPTNLGLVDAQLQANFFDQDQTIQARTEASLERRHINGDWGTIVEITDTELNSAETEDLSFGNFSGYSPAFSGQNLFRLTQRLYQESNAGGFMECSSDIYLSNMGGIVDRVVIAKNNSGQFWSPEFSYNGIGDMAIGQGYQIKIDHEDGAVADIWGNRAPADTTISLIQGWNLLGYLRTHPANAIDAFAPLVSEDLLAMAKNHDGQVYAPEFGFNGIGNLLPGAGYQVKVTEAVDFSYLPDDQDY